MTKQDYIIRSVLPEDRSEWDALYRGYAAFYKVPQTPEMRDTVWSWLHDDGKETEGLVAVTGNDTLVGLAHFRAFSRPLAASTGGFLDDLYVSPDGRGEGIADALIDGVRMVAVERGWSIVRWITADDNYRARGVYDRVADRTPWVTYDIKL